MSVCVSPSFRYFPTLAFGSKSWKYNKKARPLLVLCETRRLSISLVQNWAQLIEANQQSVRKVAQEEVELF